MFSQRDLTISTTTLHWSILLFDLCVSGEVLLHFLIPLVVVSLSVNLTEMIYLK